MTDQFLTQKVTVAFKAQIQTNGDLWKDEVLVRLTLGRRGEKRTVQGGGIDVLPAEIISEGEFEVPLATDVIEAVSTPVNVDSLSYWIYSILVLGAFPELTILRKHENRDADVGTMSFTAIVTDITPGDKEDGNADEKCTVRFVPKTYTSFVRS